MSESPAQIESPKPQGATTQVHPSRGNLAHVLPPRRVPRARPYLRLLMLLPALAMLIVGWYAYANVEPGGVIDSVKVTTKPGPVGQASEALRLVTGTFDLFLKIRTTEAAYQTSTYKEIAIGNGLVWPLQRQCKLQDMKEVNVWDEHTIRSDKNLDHIQFDGAAWSAEGQTFHIDLLGKANEPPKWALPVLSVGATLSALVILRFVWDQVI